MEMRGGTQDSSRPLSSTRCAMLTTPCNAGSPRSRVGKGTDRLCLRPSRRLKEMTGCLSCLASQPDTKVLPVVYLGWLIRGSDMSPIYAFHRQSYKRSFALARNQSRTGNGICTAELTLNDVSPDSSSLKISSKKVPSGLYSSRPIPSRSETSLASKRLYPSTNLTAPKVP